MVTDIPDLRVKVAGKRAINSAATRALRPAVDELRSKLQKAGIEKAPIPTSTSALALGELGPNPPVSAKTISMPNLSTHSDQSSTPASSLLAPASPSTAPLRLIRKPRTLPDLNPKPTSASPHVLSPSANPVCPKCQLPLFRPTSKTPLRLGTQALDGTTLATLATTGETFHLACLTCDGCDESFADGKYTVLDDCKLCEACVARRDLIAAEARVKQLEAGWSKSLAVGKGLGLARAEVARLFPNLSPLMNPSRGTDTLNNDRPDVGANLFTKKKVTGSPFLGSEPTSRPKGRFGGQTICPGCSKAGTMHETKLGPNSERWHDKCLRCVRCSKALDSGAKRFEGPSLRAGEVGCRDCLVSCDFFRFFWFWQKQR